MTYWGGMLAAGAPTTTVAGPDSRSMRGMLRGGPSLPSSSRCRLTGAGTTGTVLMALLLQHVVSSPPN